MCFHMGVMLSKLTDHSRDQTDLPEMVGGDVEDASVLDGRT